MDKKNEPKGRQNVEKIEWIGIDGLMILGYFFIVFVILMSFIYKIDFITAWVFPVALTIIVLAVTFNYARTLGGFIKMQNAKIKDNKQK